MKFRAQKVNGKLDINWDHLNLYAERWKDGALFDCEIVRRQRKRSDPMRKWYFASILPTFMHKLGYEPEEEMIFHRQLKIVFFKIKPDGRGIYRDKEIPSVFSNDSELPVSQKKEFVDWVIRKAAEYGCYIPDAGE
jgi:hypothetical protein